MPYLFLAMLSSALVSALMRLGSASGQARRPLLAVNYLTCAAVSLCFLKGGLVPRVSGWSVALAMGAVGGALYLVAFLLFQKNVLESGLALSSAFMKLGVIVPTLLGLTLFGEGLSPARGLGIALTVAAILPLSGDRTDDRPGRVPALVLLMLCGGMADGLSKFYAAYGNPALEGHFLLLAFAFALVLCALMCAAQGQRPTPREWLFGILLGVPNYLSSRFLLLALATVPASVAYPLFSCGTILLATLIGLIAFRERPGRRQWMAMAVVLIALALLNM